MTLIRRDLPSIIFPDDIIQYGWEYAYILANIPQCQNGDGSSPEKEELYDFSRFKKLFEKEDFYEKLNHLIKIGVVEEVENE